MGKFGCRLYCWGCGGCCLITGIVMGILASLIPPGMMTSIQESAFDLAYIDDTSQTEAEGLFADAGAPLAESDAFKAWGKTITETMDDCLKADFAFDWSKTPEDCIDGLHPTFSMYNFTNSETWSGSNLLDIQEVGALAALKDTQKVEADTGYWDESGKARFRITDTYSVSPKCTAQCEQSATADVLTINIWYGVFGMVGLADGWTIAHALAALPSTGGFSTLDSYLAATEGQPMDPHSALPVATKHMVRLGDIQGFLATDNAPKLGTIDLKAGEYASLKQFLWDKGKTFLESSAPKYGTPGRVVPLLQKTNANAILGWGEVPYWVDPISGAVFTFNFIGGASEKSVTFGAAPTAFIEQKMSAAFYHEGLGYVTQHYEGFTATTTYNHSCAWDPDCGAPCFPTETCAPLAAAGYDGGKVPGTYFGSAKGAPGFPEYNFFVPTYYLVITMKMAGRVVVPAKYKGPSTEDGKWDFEGFYAMSQYKASTWTRRLENCNYPDGFVTGSGAKDSPGIDCNWVKDSSPIMPFFGLPLYWSIMIRDSVPDGWDPVLTNAEDGAASMTMSAHVNLKSCMGNALCTDEYVPSRSAAYKSVAITGYEPNLGALVDITFSAGVSWKLTITSMNGDLAGFRMMPLFWFCNYLHLPGAINMDLSKIQAIPAALNGFYIFLITQCMVSLIGGVACCFCGV